MQYHRTSALVESGILAAVAVLFTLVGNYVPVLDLVVSILWPLPIILCGRRNGLKWSILCLIVTGAVVAVLLSPLQALTQCVILGLIGLFMGEGMRRQLSPASILLLGSLGALLSTGLSILAAYYLMDINVVKSFFEGIEESLTMSNEIFQTIGMSGMTAVQLAQLRHIFELILPSGVLLSAPITAFANYWAARKVLARMGDYYPWFPPASRWTMPRGILLVYFAGMVCVTLYQKNQDLLPYRAGYTVFMLGSMLLLLQGLCLIRWYVEEKNAPRIIMPLALLLTFTMPLASQLVVVMGAYEMLFDVRKIRRAKQEEENHG